ncbi:hypothetical protein EYV94_28080 [Puteibacter caeruleilacunae]|nr:hypothetical protein EYV94_28080 [Puteibacter caeruleilacunae]
MKNIRLRCACFFILLFFKAVTCISNPHIDSTKKLVSICRVWGFLKYYHPEVASGNFNWDQQLIEILPKVQKAATKEQLSKVYIDWIVSLGKVKERNIKIRDDYFNHNFDLTWINDSEIFTTELSQKLEFIENNRNQWLKRSDHASKNGPNGATLKDGAIIGKKLFTHSSRHLFLETHL